MAASVLRGLYRLFTQSATKRLDMRINATGKLRSARISSARIARAAAEELAEEAAELAEEAGDTIIQAYYQAMDTMFGMCGNAGQETVFNDKVIDAFVEGISNSDPEYGWEDVNIGEYMDFMGEIVEEGNGIMSDAYDEAGSLLAEAEDIESEIEDLEEGEFDEETGERFF
jgi:hypothetical protein